jgi:hypothetical protein
VFCTLRHKTNLKMGRRTGRTRPWADGREPFKGYRTGRSETRIKNLRGAATADAITMGSLLRVLRGSLNFKDSVTLLTVSIVIFTRHRMSKCTAYLCNMFRHARSRHISLVTTFSYRASAAGFEMQVQHEPQSTVACGSVGVLRFRSTFGVGGPLLPAQVPDQGQGRGRADRIVPLLPTSSLHCVRYFLGDTEHDGAVSCAQRNVTQCASRLLPRQFETRTRGRINATTRKTRFPSAYNVTCLSNPRD